MIGAGVVVIEVEITEDIEVEEDEEILMVEDVDEEAFKIREMNVEGMRGEIVGLRERMKEGIGMVVSTEGETKEI